MQFNVYLFSKISSRRDFKIQAPIYGKYLKADFYLKKNTFYVFSEKKALRIQLPDKTENFAVQDSWSPLQIV